MRAIYMSYCPEDKLLAGKLTHALTEAGVTIWNTNGHTETNLFSKSLDQALKIYDVLLLLWSEAARSCRSVERDWTNALVFDKRIVSLVLDDTAVPAALLRGSLLDFRGARRNWSRLLGSLGNGYTQEFDQIAPLSTDSALTTLPERKYRLSGNLDLEPAAGETVQLRSKPLLALSIDDVEEMLEARDFYDKTWRQYGHGIQNQFAPENQFGDRLVVDRKTALVWQQGGSKSWMVYADAKRYISELNDSYFGGYTDWRLPTLEEAMSLVEPQPSANGLHISTFFRPEQRYIWTADKQCEEVVWFTAFPNGGVGSCRVSNYNSVRAVRENK